MNDQTFQFPRFFVTAPSPCPYLIGRNERKIFTELRGPDVSLFNEALGRLGFRRSQNVAYRPSCDGCTACLSVRVKALEFKPNSTMRRLMRRNRDLTVTPTEPWATDEQFELLQRYLSHRHPSGGMVNMSADDYSDMIEQTPVDTAVYEYREPQSGTLGKLIAVSLTDHYSDGLSMVYSFYEPDHERQGLGTYMILDHIARSQRQNLPYVYLGYWIKNCRQMDYKVRYRPIEVLSYGGWRAFTEDDIEGD